MHDGVSIIQGDSTLPDGRRIILITIPDALKKMSKADNGFFTNEIS